MTQVNSETGLPPQCSQGSSASNVANRQQKAISEWSAIVSCSREFTASFFEGLGRNKPCTGTGIGENQSSSGISHTGAVGGLSHLPTNYGGNTVALHTSTADSFGECRNTESSSTQIHLECRRAPASAFVLRVFFLWKEASGVLHALCSSAQCSWVPKHWEARCRSLHIGRVPIFLQLKN